MGVTTVDRLNAQENRPVYFTKKRAAIQGTAALGNLVIYVKFSL
jgi:hypothetical protein